jgi:hypothetical protein
MQVQIRRWENAAATLLFVAGVSMLASCASRQDVALVNDPDAKKETTIPWNRQEKWEGGGQFGNITDRR